MIIENFELQEKKKKAEAGKSTEDASDSKEEEKEERVITLRSLTMEDMRQAKNQVTSHSFSNFCRKKLPFSFFCIYVYTRNGVMQVAASFAAEGSVMSELKQWNDLYGEGGSRKKQQLTYFL